MEIRRILMAVATVFSAACTSTTAEVDLPEGELTRIELKARHERSVRTYLEGTSVLWSPEDQISVFDIYDRDNFPFENSSEDPSVAVFKGIAPLSDWYVALYPYQEDAVLASDCSTLTATLSSLQTAVEGSFDDGINLAVAKGGTRDELQFKNVCSLLGFRFTWAENATSRDLISIKLYAKGLTGRASLDCSGEVPSVKEIIAAEDSVEIYGNVEAGETYYAVAYPGTYSDMRIVLTDSKGYSAEFTQPDPLTVERCANVLVADIEIPAGKDWGDKLFYRKVTENSGLLSGEYLIVYEASYPLALDGNTDFEKGKGPGIGITKEADGTVAYSAKLSLSAFTFNATDGSFRNKGGKYAGSTSKDNAIVYSESPLGNEVTVGTDGTAVIKSTASGYKLMYNSSASCFRYYSGSSTGLKPVSLYRLDGKAPERPEEDEDDDDDEEEEDEEDDPPVTPPAQKATYNWFEHPSIVDENKDGICDTNPDLYYAYHLFNMGGKRYRNYTVCFSAKHHCALWVAAPRHALWAAGSGRHDAYKPDPYIPASIQFNSKDTGGGCNKGHLVGSAERTCNIEANHQVFYYSNIAPQLSSGYNTGGGGWNILEDYIDTKVPSDTLYEVIGCYYDEYTDGYGNKVSPKTISFGGRNDVSFPTMFYYAVLRTKSGSTRKKVSDCTANELMCVAFVRSHTNSLKGQKPSIKEMMSIADLEKITGCTYFVNVPNAPKNKFNASDWGL